MKTKITKLKHGPSWKHWPDFVFLIIQNDIWNECSVHKICTSFPKRFSTCYKHALDLRGEMRALSHTACKGCEGSTVWFLEGRLRNFCKGWPIWKDTSRISITGLCNKQCKKVQKVLPVKKELAVFPVTFLITFGNTLTLKCKGLTCVVALNTKGPFSGIQSLGLSLI